MAHAHGEEPRLEISPERLNPGGVVDVRGAGFEPEERIALALVGDGFELPLGQIDADQEGIFLQSVPLPADLAEGPYRFRAVSDDHEIFSPTLTVFGQAVLEAEGGQGPRDEEDVLLAPMPTSAPAALPTPLPDSDGASSQPEPRFSRAGLTILLVLILLLTGGLVLVRLRLARTG